MKTIALLYFLTAGISPAQSGPSGWFQNSPNFTGPSDVVSITVLDTRAAVAVGRNRILRTTDGGATWTSHYLGYDKYPSAVSFTDANTGTIVGSTYDFDTDDVGPALILRTTDGGARGSSQSSGTLNSLAAVSVTDANTGTAVGSSGTILRTTDGGTTWNVQSSGT